MRLNVQDANELFRGLGLPGVKENLLETKAVAEIEASGEIAYRLLKLHDIRHRKRMSPVQRVAFGVETLEYILQRFSFDLAGEHAVIDGGVDLLVGQLFQTTELEPVRVSVLVDLLLL